MRSLDALQSRLGDGAGPAPQSSMHVSRICHRASRCSRPRPASHPCRRQRAAGRYDVLICDIWGVLHDGAEPMRAPFARCVASAPRAAVSYCCPTRPTPRIGWPGSGRKASAAGRLGRDRLVRRHHHRACRQRLCASTILVRCRATERCSSGFPAVSTRSTRRRRSCQRPAGRPDETAEPISRCWSRHWRAGCRWCAPIPTWSSTSAAGCRHVPAPSRLSTRRWVARCTGPASRTRLPTGRRLARANELRGMAVARSRILAIGDAIRTDIAGAQAAGIDALLVGHGIHRGELMRDGLMMQRRSRGCSATAHRDRWRRSPASTGRTPFGIRLRPASRPRRSAADRPAGKQVEQVLFQLFCINC